MRLCKGPHQNAADGAGREDLAFRKGEIAETSTDAGHQRHGPDEDKGSAGKAEQADRDTVTVNSATRGRETAAGERDEHENPITRQGPQRLASEKRDTNRTPNGLGTGTVEDPVHCSGRRHPTEVQRPRDEGEASHPASKPGGEDADKATEQPGGRQLTAASGS